MFSNITSFFWGSSNPSPMDPVPLDSDLCSLKSEESVEDKVESRLSPDALISLSSLSDEEADWVFVNNGQERGENGIPIEVTPEQRERYELLRRNLRRNNSDSTENSEASNRVTTRSSHNNNNNNTSAFSAESALKALQAKVIRPEQKAARREKELRLKHKHLERTNLCRMVESSSNRPHKRRSRYTPTLSSRAVNNRKC